MPRKKKNNAGFVLLAVLWILLILSMLSLGLGRRARIDVALSRYAAGKVKARAIAWGGLLHALGRMQSDSRGARGRAGDTRYECGVTFADGETAEQVFRNIPLGGGYFEVSYTVHDNGDAICYGMSDEQARVNLNALTAQDHTVLSHLLVLLGADEDTAAVVSSSVVDWRDADAEVTGADAGAEDDYYEGLSPAYRAKNAAFESIDELRLVRGVTPEIFARLVPYVTVFPPDPGRLHINVNTAPAVVLSAVARSMAGPKTNTSRDDADSLVAKIIAYRNGEDGIPCTADDRPVKHDELALNAKERALFLTAQIYLADASDYMRVRVRGVDEWSQAESRLEAIVYRGDASVVWWRRD